MRADQFLRDYFDEDENFIIAMKLPPKTTGEKPYTRHKLLNIQDPNLYKFLGHCYYTNKDENADIYFTLNTYKPQNSNKTTRKEEMVQSIKSFYFDIDKDVENIYKKVIELFKEPTYTIQSSEGKYQLIYKFKEPYSGDFTYFKQLLKGVVYQLHPIDKLFDTARIFRLAGYKNKKPGNKDFLVSIEKNEHYYSFDEFETIARAFIIQESNPPTKSAQTPQKSAKEKKMPSSADVDNFKQYKDIKKKINKKYSELLEKYNHDKSTADLAFVKWLRYSKMIEDEEILTLKLFEARGYENLMQKHGYQIQYYLQNILEKSI